MAIKLSPKESESRLFCASKFWGDPDMPAEMQYPMLQVEEDGDKFEIPLTFICQIDCADLKKFDKTGLVPEEGMFYFFGAVDELLGYESPVRTVIGEWPKGRVAVKYTKSINYETFQSQIMVDDEENPISEPPMAIEFTECEDDEPGVKMFFGDKILQLTSEFGFSFPQGMTLDFVMTESDMKFGNWKRAKGVLAE